MADYPCIFNDDATVGRYYRLRHVAPHVLSEISRLVCNLAASDGLFQPCCILDAGAGDGRLLVPISKELESQNVSATLLAVDICEPMLKSLQERWTTSNREVLLKCIQADLEEPLPIPGESAHVVFTLATFHILKRWREALQNLVRVLRPAGYFIFIRENNQFMHETEGFEHDSDFLVLTVELREFMRYYHEQRALLGEPYQPRELRYSDMMPGVRYLAELGLEEKHFKSAIGAFEWQKPHTFEDILQCFKNRQMTTWGSDLSDRAREKISACLEGWVNSRGIDSKREFLLPAKLIPHVFRKTR